MRAAGLMARVATLYHRSPGTEKFYARHRNLRLDLAAPDAPDQQWAGDLTYIKVGSRWHYLAVVMDLYSRRVLGWSLGRQKTAGLTLRALRYAIRNRCPAPGLIFHTDRGVEYGARLLQNELQRHGMRSSMNRPGVCTDNAHMESFFHSLKAEKVHGFVYESERELRVAIAGYINKFYNPIRLHSGIGYVTPNEYEQLAV